MGHFICFGVILSLFSSSAMLNHKCSKPSIELSEPITEQLRGKYFWTIYFNEIPTIYPPNNKVNTGHFVILNDVENVIDMKVEYNYTLDFPFGRAIFTYTIVAYKEVGIFELTGAPNYTTSPGFVFALSAADTRNKLYIYRDCARTSSLFWVQTDQEDYYALSNFSDTAVSNVFHMAGLSQELQEMKRKHWI